MGAWEEQSKRTTQRRKIWSESQEFSFIDALLNATNEEEVKAAFIREFLLPVKTRERHDLQVDKILFEFKYAVKFNDLEVAAKVVAQAIYYINRLLKKDRVNEVKYLIVADKDEARLFRVLDFRPFYESDEYRWDDFRPSSPDPRLIQAIKDSKLLDSNRVYKLTSQDDVQVFSSLLYKILSNKNEALVSTSSEHGLQHLAGVKNWIVILALFLSITSISAIGIRYYFNKYNREASPAINR
ncbi:MAG: hypothetical protein AAFW84_09060 [Cyanobacteria bacterium J06635_15]